MFGIEVIIKKRMMEFGEKEGKFTKDISINKDYISTSDMGNYIIDKLKGENGE